MVLSICLIGFCQDLVIVYSLAQLHVLDSLNASAEISSFLSGFGILGLLLSLANFLVNYTRLGDANNKRRTANFVLGTVAFALFIGYVAFRYVMRIHDIGAVVF